MLHLILFIAGFDFLFLQKYTNLNGAHNFLPYHISIYLYFRIYFLSFFYLKKTCLITSKTMLKMLKLSGSVCIDSLSVRQIRMTNITKYVSCENIQFSIFLFLVSVPLLLGSEEVLVLLIIGTYEV